MKAAFVFWTAVLICLAPLRSVAGQEAAAFTPENILKFADYLYQEKDYLRAAAEYRRYLLLANAPPPEAASIHFKIGLCFRSAQDYGNSVSAFRFLIEKFPESDTAEEARVQVAYGHFLSGEYRESLASADAFLAEIKSGEKRLRLVQLKGVDYLYQRQWAKAGDYFRSLDGQTGSDVLTMALKGFADQGLRLRRKSPVLAGILSALIPGTGRMYAGRTTDGLFSLMTIALTAWQAYDGFHKEGTGSLKGWIYGSIGGFFYVGNVYGSVAAARIYNEQSERKLLEQLGVSVRALFQ